MDPSVVLVKAKVSIGPTVEMGLLTLVTVKVPVAPAKRPVPPVMVFTVVAAAVEVKVAVPEKLANSSSPLDATVVPEPVKVIVLPMYLIV